MTYQYPRQLAEVVLERWHTFISRHDNAPPPDLPSLDDLRNILETAFFASLEREEGRALTFTLCCTPSSPIRREHSSDEVPVLSFSQPRTLTVHSLRALAPAVSRYQAAIVVQYPSRFDEQPESVIGGIALIGSDLAVARAGRSFYHRPPPYALVVEIRGPGRLHVYQGSYKLIALEGGELVESSIVSTLEYVFASDILRRGEKILMNRITPPSVEPEREWVEFQWIALLNAILAVVNCIKDLGHGGTLLLVAPEAVPTLPVRYKYEASDAGIFETRFIEFINLRHKIGDADWIAETEPTPPPRDHLLARRFAAAEVELADAETFVGQLSAVDGAVVLTSALRLVGFGAEILLDQAGDTRVFEIIGDPLVTRDRPELDSQSFGMRHRSAVRFVAATSHTAAFIASQDGAISFCWKDDKGRVCLKRNVNLSNPNMAGA